MAKGPKRQSLVLGPLPVDVINRTIETDLVEGVVILTAAAQVHAQRRHPEDFSLILPHIGAIVTAPFYIGDDHRNPDKIELIGRIPGAGVVALVAVSIERDEDGHYRVASFYQISEEKLQTRRSRGFLKIARK